MLAQKRKGLKHTTAEEEEEDCNVLSSGITRSTHMWWGESPVSIHDHHRAKKTISLFIVHLDTHSECSVSAAASVFQSIPHINFK